MCVCVRGVRVCVCVCARALRIVSTENISRFINTLIIISIILCHCFSLIKIVPKRYTHTVDSTFKSKMANSSSRRRVSRTTTDAVTLACQVE